MPPARLSTRVPLDLRLDRERRDARRSLTRAVRIEAAYLRSLSRDMARRAKIVSRRPDDLPSL